MAYYLAISDGTTTVDLSNISDYQPMAGPDSANTVQETIQIRLGPTWSTARGQLRQISGLLVRAADRFNRLTGARIYLLFTPDDSGTQHRSEIYSGNITPAGGIMQRAQRSGELFLHALTITRANYFEQSAAVVLTAGTDFTSPGGAGTTTNSRVVTNGGYIEIVTDNLTGELPAPLNIGMTNRNASTDDLQEVYIAGRTRSLGPQAFTGATGGTADADALSGYRLDVAVTTTEASAKAFSFADFPIGPGLWLVPFIRFSDHANAANVPNLLARWRVEMDSSVVFDSGQYRFPDNGRLIQPMPTNYIMPWDSQIFPVTVGCTIELFLQSAAGNIDISLDWFAFAHTDSFTRLNCPTGGPEPTYQLICAGSRDSSSYTQAAGAQTGAVETMYSWPVAWPPLKASSNADQGYSFFYNSDSGTADNDWPLDITVNYHPRRRVI